MARKPKTVRASLIAEDDAAELQVAPFEFTRDLYLRMRPRKWIIRKVAKTFGFTERQAQNYMSKVEDEYTVHTEADRDQEIAQWLAKLDKLEAEYEEIKALAQNDGDYVAVKACQDSKLVLHRERAKFRGLYAPERSEHRHVVEMTDAELLAEVKATVMQLPPEERQQLLLEAPIDVEVVERQEEEA